MFTGIIRDLGRVTAITPIGGDVRLEIAIRNLDMGVAAPGDSIAVNGACLTMLDIKSTGFSADVSRETLQVTSLQHAKPGREVNLEPAMSLSDGVHGHLVSGHVDDTARVRSVKSDGRSWRFRFELPSELKHLVAAKGSITVDGVSLTVNDVTDHDFGVNIIPHTFESTIFKHYRADSIVNLEIDLIARYTARLLQAGAGNGEPR